MKKSVRRRSSSKPRKKSKEEKKEVKDSTRGRKKLTDYQKFVKKESQKEKYKGLKPEDRIAKIAKAWKKYSLKTQKVDKNVRRSKR
jgi:hypothetical protein